ncbi:phage fiber-tail adaptor protein [Acetobacter thailandicus]|uniref:phage fiber-tail adaptor protein n=1 Tax=Acetobacter thailandicus TaxID=1502842 RepID=UPI001BAD37FC|nr:hypothetical protein [Acetobacter thailandicus]
MTAPLLSPGWRPSPARMIKLAAVPDLRLRGLVACQAQLSWAPKSGADNLDFSLDASGWLKGTEDYLACVSACVPTVTGLETDLRVLWATVMSGLACFFLGGGIPGTVQTVQLTLVTQQGRRLTLPVSVAIRTDSAAAPPVCVPHLADGTPLPPNTLSLQNDVALTTNDGKPYLIA